VGAAEAVAGTSGSWGLAGRSTAGLAGTSISGRRMSCRAFGCGPAVRTGAVGLVPFVVGMVLVMAWGGALRVVQWKGIGPGFFAWPLNRAPCGGLVSGSTSCAAPPTGRLGSAGRP